MNSTEIKALYKLNVMQTYARFDVVLERGEGARLYSPEGKEYIDSQAASASIASATATPAGRRPSSNRP
jgi:acetylornithine/succinyldiaminopimelate/putrescine aminotransferase